MASRLLDTRFKDKLASGWSYPIGANVLSAFLKDVAYPEPHPICFRARATYRASKFAERRKEGSPYPILRAHMGGQRVALNARLLGEPERSTTGWTVELYAVPAGCKSICRRAMISHVLLILSFWL